MKTIKLSMMLLATAVLSSCSSYVFTSRTADIEENTIRATETIVDVVPDFSKRIVVSSNRQKTAELAMDQARYMAVVDNNCDVVVDPIFKVEKRGSKFIAHLTGFAGFFKNPRTLYEDINLLKDVSREDIDKYLILQDPKVLSVMNQKTGDSEVINIYNGKPAPPCDKAVVTNTAAPTPAVAPVPAAASTKTNTKSRK